MTAPADALDQLRRYAPDVVEPDDFDVFWRDTLAGAAAHPVLVDVRPERTDLRLVHTWDVTFAGFGGDRVRAWYTRPAGTDAPLPTVVEYAGYGRGRGLPHERLTWPVAGYAHLLMDNRGQSGQYAVGDTPDRHGAPGGPWPVTWGILDPRDYHYRRLITDAVRAVDAARALPGVDPTRVAAVGNSQGGGLALAVAGLVDGLAALLTTAPFLCDVQRAVTLTDVAPYGEIGRYLAVHREAEEAVRRTLSYVDGVSFARRATAPAHFGIGLRDTVCPPSTGFAAYNRYGTGTGADPEAREIHVYPFNGHEGGEALHVRRQLRWLAATLGAPPAAGRA
ncbi:acetylxylan esterase [Micromonospora endolithica]|uniref:Acetylxylan esterase n=1 Tax=Micromonospora endolithica TaxID=230091 RepID=A0A3A9YUZ3_9ACTN|nr:acetylxylan esterase [Micromonospora endolithica]RKN39589.1 acetylxylan esterase [Micromonospora endolithica]TWJ22280.1 cephalosporin-C deacetylase [Micromonospora endolithica]